MLSIGIVLGMSSAVAFGLLDSLISIASRYIGIVRTIVLAQGISALLILVYLVTVLKTGAIAQPESVPLLLLVGVVLGVVNTCANLSLYRGLEIGPVALVSPIAASYGLVTTILALIIDHEMLHPLQYVAICLVFGGVVLAATDSKQLALHRSSILSKWSLYFRCRKLPDGWWRLYGKNLGLAYGLGAMLCFGIEFFILSSATAQLGPTQPILWSRTCSVILLLGYACSRRTNIWSGIQWKHLSIIVLIGLFDTLGMIWYDMGTSQSATSIVATLSSTYLLIPTLLGIVVYREKLQRLQWVGVCSIVAGVVLLALVGN